MDTWGLECEVVQSKCVVGIGREMKISQKESEYEANTPGRNETPKPNFAANDPDLKNFDALAVSFQHYPRERTIS